MALQLFLVFCMFGVCLMTTNREELLLKDPILWPGHLEPFGSQQVTGKVEETDTWPDPVTFFREYIDKNKPLLFKGLAKKSPAFTKFSDDYFRNAAGADETTIYAEPELKENRTKQGFQISMKEFIDRYHKETLYMVNKLPAQYTSDVRMPAPLRCDSTRDLMSSQVTWFSSGGTKSVLHNDDVDNINCLFRGSKDLWFIEYDKNKDFVPIDRPQGGYSSLDVDKVNYTQFPQLRKVDMYYKAVMEEGDCLFIPYHWFHQVNSVANEESKMNLAVNVWFKHKIGHIPKDCTLSESDATLDKYRFPDDEKEEQGNDQGSIIGALAELIPPKKYATLKNFAKILTRSPLINPTEQKLEDIPDTFKAIAEKMFIQLDITKDGKLSQKDFRYMEKLDDDGFKQFEDQLSGLIAEGENFFEDIVEEKNRAGVAGEEEEDSASEVTEEDLDSASIGAAKEEL